MTPTRYVEIIERQCSKCKVTYPRESFYKDRSSIYGIQHVCKGCMKGYSSRYKEKNPDYFANKGKERYKPEENADRYQRYRGDYLRRRSERSQTVEGKLYDLWASCRERSRRKGLDFSIELEWLVYLFKVQKGKCSMTGVNLTLETKGARGFNPYNPSLDRIDPKKGYTKDNVRLVCVAFNIALNAWGEEVYRKVAEGYILHHPLEVTPEPSPTSMPPEEP